MSSDASFYDVKMYILNKATEAELQEMYDYARARTNELGVLNAAKFKSGDPIMFDGGRNRGMIQGTFVRLLQKNAVVKDLHGMEWKVSPNLLQEDPNPPTANGGGVKLTFVPLNRP